MSELSKNQRRSPRQARSMATYDAILEAASQILERDGMEGFNTNAVAARAGVSVGTLYQYFADKQAVLLAAADRAFSRASLASRQRVLLRALMAMLEAVGRLGGHAGGRTAVTRATGPEPDDARKWARPRDRRLRLAEFVRQAVTGAAALTESLLTPGPGRALIVAAPARATTSRARNA
jgi:AcrR family transcriptional regulator